MYVGARVGETVGKIEGAKLGSGVGDLAEYVGAKVGIDEGRADGATLGLGEGAPAT